MFFTENNSAAGREDKKRKWFLIHSSSVFLIGTTWERILSVLIFIQISWLVDAPCVCSLFITDFYVNLQLSKQANKQNIFAFLLCATCITQIIQ